ncbi:helix-turn-helix domain-containing protein [Streptococcus catagoni]|uniref:helix-turn-helix domain-containing protein n=1 Tax=Streptococcus catagoni TaxID=2654874 RepID=UPI001F1C13B8|nr:helix-turn-helix transcriptional regulator [Streptococcus catagoni]
MKLIFSQQLVKLRKENNFSQDELAEKIFISRQAISKRERGEVTPDLAKIEQIAVVFGVTTEFLLFGKNFEDDWCVETSSMMRLKNEILKEEENVLIN